MLCIMGDGDIHVQNGVVPELPGQQGSLDSFLRMDVAWSSAVLALLWHELNALSSFFVPYKRMWRHSRYKYKIFCFCDTCAVRLTTFKTRLVRRKHLHLAGACEYWFLVHLMLLEDWIILVRRCTGGSLCTHTIWWIDCWADWSFYSVMTS